MLTKITNPELFRENITKKLCILIGDEKTCSNLEKSVYNYAIKEANNRKIIKKWENPYFVQLYTDRLRSIYNNLKNTEFLTQIKSKEISPKSLETMTHQEMNPQHWHNMIDRKMKRDASKFTVNFQASTDMFTCRKCKSKRSSYFELQTRSADEPATIFITCLDCGTQSKR